MKRPGGSEPDRTPAEFAVPFVRANASRFAWFTGALLLGAVIVLVTHRAEGRELMRLLREAQPLWLLGAAVLQVATYVCAAAVWHRALVRHGAHETLRGLVPLGLAKLFTDQALPSAGLSGTLLVVRSLVQRGTPRPIAMATMLTGLFAYYGAYCIAMLATVAILGAQGRLRPVILVPAALVGLIAASLPVLLFAVRRAPHGRLRDWLERLPGAGELAVALRDVPPRALLGPRVFAETVALQLGIFALDALTLDFTLRAVASHLSVASSFASFVVASAVATLAWIPGGLGTFEASCVAMLHLEGVSVEGALAATLLLRGLTFWLPMLPGLALAHREMGRAATE